MEEAMRAQSRVIQTIGTTAEGCGWDGAVKGLKHPIRFCLDHCVVHYRHSFHLQIHVQISEYEFTYEETEASHSHSSSCP